MNERLLYTLFFVQPTSEIEFMALFSLLVDNTYRRLLDVKRDSRYYSEIMESLWCFFHLIHAEERKSYEGNSGRCFDTSKLVKIIFQKGHEATIRSFLSIVSRKRRENFSIFRFWMGPQKVLSTFPNVYKFAKQSFVSCN